MISFDDAKAIVLQHAHSFGVEELHVHDATGRVLAADVFADRDYPPFNRAAMDGYAIRFQDFHAKAVFQNIETILPGHSASRSLQPGDCYRIMTGAAVPAPADTVIRIEDCHESGSAVSFILQEPRQWQNISKQGEDVSKGYIVCKSGTIITAPVAAVIAAVGCATVSVQRKPTAAIITTGNEVVSGSGSVGEFEIRNSNQVQVVSLLRQAGITDIRMQHVIDDPFQMARAFESVFDADIIVSCGAVSAGIADYIPAVLQQLDVQLLFHKVAMKPGKPILVGKRTNGKIVFSLPGNPLSCLACFVLFVRPYLQACEGVVLSELCRYPMGEAYTKKTPLDEFYPGVLNKTTMQAERLSFNGSGDIRAAIAADGFIRHRADKPTISTGELVEFIPL